MPVAPSFQDCVDVGVAEGQARRADLDFGEGDYSLAIVHAGAAMHDMSLRFYAQAFRETFLDGCSGDALTALASDRYNIERDEASFAQVTVAFTRTSGGADGSIPVGTRIATAFDARGNAVAFTTDAGIVVGNTLNGPFEVLCTAEVAGRDGNIQAVTLTRIEDTLFDSTFTVTNADAAAGGNDAQSDEDLRVECRSFFSTLRRGTKAAVEFGAKQVASVANARAIEASGGGGGVVYVSDSDGNSNLQMLSDVEVELENWRPFGATVTITGGEQLLVSIDLSLVVREGFSVDSRADDIIAAVESRINKLRAGETLYLDMLVAAVIAIAPDDILDVVFDAITVDGSAADPDDNVEPTAVQVIRPDTVTVTEAD